MTRSRGNSSAPVSSAGKVARVVVAGVVVAGAPLALSGTANAASDDVWDRIAQCESGGRWNTNTGNGHSGGLQFTQSTWRAHGGQGSPANASRTQQIAVAERVLASQGWGAWPACSKRVGARGGPTPRTMPAKRPAAAAAPAPAAPAPAAPAPAAPAPAAPAAPAGPGAARGAKYVVAPGDSLSKIAKAKNTPGGWQELHARNKDTVANPNLLTVGQALTVD